MRGMAAFDFKRSKIVGRYPLDLHLRHQLRETVCEREDPGAALKTGKPPDELFDELRQLKATAKFWDRRGQARHRQITQIRNKANARHETIPVPIECLFDRALHPARVQIERNPSHGLGRLIAETRDQPAHEGVGKIDTDGQRVEARFKHRLPPTSPLRAECSPGARHRTSRPDGSGQRRDLPRSACPKED